MHRIEMYFFNLLASRDILYWNIYMHNFTIGEFKDNL